MKLKLESNLPAPDDFYQALIDMHRDLSDEQSQTVNARLILLFANHIGDMETLSEAMALARSDLSRQGAEDAKESQSHPR